jgi:hypothetical protein
LRLIHLYFGVFTAPAILFFAFTGILQTLSLHQSDKSGSYKVPAWIAELAQLHKKQTLQLPARRPQQPDSASGEGPAKPPKSSPIASTDSRPASNSVPMKVFFVVVGIALILSTFTGLVMSYKYAQQRTLLLLLLFAGIVVPVFLALL